MLLTFCYSLVLGILLNFIIIELLYYVWCIMYDVWWLGYIYQELFMYLCYFEMFYIQWQYLAKKDLWDKVYINWIIMNTNVSHEVGTRFLSIT
jgi:hypothetical protein